MKEKIVDMLVSLTGCEELRENNDLNLLEEDILDSLAFIELIVQLEESFDIEIQPTQIAPDTWESAEGILKMVEKLIDEQH